jgi:quinol monooxygenase YgiN
MRISSVLASALTASALLAWTGLANSQTSDGPIVLVSRFYATPGRENEVQARFLKIVEFVRKAEPNTVYRLHRSAQEPAVFLWYEAYESQAALDTHRNVVMPAFLKEQGPRIEGLFSRPPETESYIDISR